ncbi:hypothetical protein GDO81_001151 [Engystomops pustulosus]|uniref:Uncharacterized protein n=1 Tax=Engystomops pustulosus TaxID=76066 RepID=A0AAV7DBJ4_ENGPU|nr:hypothetical protein GDO81_001151 [Engystomops pustulosus]
MDENKPSVKWFIETQSEWFLRNGIPEWFHGVITRKAQDRFRHFMIDVLQAQQCILSGDTRIHNTLEDLVNFHTQHPLYPYNEILTLPCGQKTESCADYEELFENGSTLPQPFSGVENSPIDMALTPSQPVGTNVPPVPPRRMQSSVSLNSQIMIPPCDLTKGNRLYPLLPTEGQMPYGVPVNTGVHRSITKSQSVDLPYPNTTHSSNWPNKEGEKLGNASKKPLKTYKTALNKAVTFMKEGELALDLKKMENTMAAQMEKVRDSFGRIGHTGQKNPSPPSQPRHHQPSVPEEYRAPPPFAPGFS